MGIFNWKKNPIPTPEGVCPNCWGQQEYGGKAIDLMEDKQIDVNNSTSSHVGKSAEYADLFLLQIKWVEKMKSRNAYYRFYFR